MRRSGSAFKFMEAILFYKLESSLITLPKCYVCVCVFFCFNSFLF